MATHKITVYLDNASDELALEIAGGLEGAASDSFAYAGIKVKKVLPPLLNEREAELTPA